MQEKCNKKVFNLESVMTKKACIKVLKRLEGVSFTLIVSFLILESI